MEGVLEVHKYRRGFERSISGCVTTMLYSPLPRSTNDVRVRIHNIRSALPEPEIEILYTVYEEGKYNVMQSDGNSFHRDVVSDSFNETSRDENSMSDQIYVSKYVRSIIMMILILYNIVRKYILTLQ